VREMLHGAVAGARDIVGDVVQVFRDGNQVTDDEALAQYAKVWDRPTELMAYVARHAPAGSDVLEEAVKYEKEMYPLMRARMGGG